MTTPPIRSNNDSDIQLDIIRADNLDRLAGYDHGFCARAGGVSDPDGALNCGLRSSDKPARVEENRRRVSVAFGGPLRSVRQVHGTAVVTIEDEDQVTHDQDADAMVTALSGIGLGILTADCGPLCFIDPVAGVIGAAHAGWRGAHAGVAATTLDAMEALGAERHQTHVWLGPTIQQNSYEVGPEFPKRFGDAEGLFKPAKRPDHHLFNLPLFIENQVRALGVASFERAYLDTCADSARCFSYRRATLNNAPDYHRHVTVVIKHGDPPLRQFSPQPSSLYSA